ncbi:MAG TPA: RidA family protein [Sphingomicrobium sp.]|nr:RidA family protein [Sphingomicrobium sp.]
MTEGLSRSLLIACAIASLPTAAEAQSTPPKEAIVPKGWEFATNDLHFSPAVRSGDFVFVSGVPAGLRPSETEADKEKAIDRAFQGIAKVLAEAGASWDDVVQITSYHTDFTAGGKPNDQQALFRQVKDRYVNAPYPAWTAVGVTRLWNEALFAEISVIARAPAKPR